MRDIPPRAALVVIALALLASVVMGREEPAPEVIEPAMPARPASAARPETSPAARSGEVLELSRLRRVAPRAQVTNLFAAKTWVANVRAPAKPAVMIPAAPPRPVAPPLPFTYLGRMVQGGKTVVFLGHGSDAVAAKAGDLIEGKYRVASLSDSAVTFIYLPLKTKQMLSITGTK